MFPHGGPCSEEGRLRGLGAGWKKCSAEADYVDILSGDIFPWPPFVRSERNPPVRAESGQRVPARGARIEDEGEIRQSVPDWSASPEFIVIEIRLLGPFRALSPLKGDITPHSRRAQALLAMVALSEYGERSRGWLQSKLWSDRPAAQAAASLRQELSRLRRLIGSEHLLTEGDRVSLRDVRVDVLDLVNSGSVVADFIAAEVPDLLEGLDIRDEAFEEWLRLERAHWRERVEVLPRDPGTGGRPAETVPGEPVTRPPPRWIAPGSLPAQPRLPTLGILPCVVRTGDERLAPVGELFCDLISKVLIENGTYAVFDFRDLRREFSESVDARTNPTSGPDLLLSVRLNQIASMVEVAVGVRRVDDGRLIWTQSFASDPTDQTLFNGEWASVFVNQAVEAIELWLLKNIENEKLCASRLTLAAAHRVFTISDSDLDWAERQLGAAFELERSPLQLAWLALLECVRHGERLTDRPQESAERVRDYTARALEIERGNSLALSLLGHANAFVLRNYDLADELIAEAIRINPHRAVTWDAHAMLQIYAGDTAAGHRSARRAKSLGRYSPYAFWYEASCAIGATLVGRHEEAVRHGGIVLAQRPDFRPTLRHQIASLALCGRVAEAQQVYRELRRLEPDFSLQKLRADGYPTPSTDSIAMIEAGLTKAGVEGRAP